MKNIHVLPTKQPSRLLKQNKGKLIISKEIVHSHISKHLGNINQNIYITSDEEIKEGDAYITKHGEICKSHNGSKILLFETDKKIILTDNKDLIKDGVQAIDADFLEWFVKNPSCEEVEVQKWFDGVDFTEYKIIIPKEEPKKNCFSLPNCTCKEPDIDAMKGLCKICGNSTIHLGERVYVEAKQIVQEYEQQGLEKYSYELEPKETLEEIAEKMVREHPDFEAEGMSEYQNGRFNGIIEGAELQQERSYSEEDMYWAMNMAKGFTDSGKSDVDIYNHFEQFKKK